MSESARPVASLVLRLRGLTARVTPATRGQWNMWRAIRYTGEHDRFFNLCEVLPIPQGRDLRATLDAVREVLRRYETLRTAYLPTYDPARTTYYPACGDRLDQVVSAEGEVPVELYEIPPELTSQEQILEFLEQVVPRLREPQFAAHARAVRDGPEPPIAAGGEWPIRLAVVLSEGRPMFLAAAFSHLCLDSDGIAVVAQELMRLLEGGAPDPVPAWQPADLAIHELSPAGQIENERAMAYIRKVFRSAPPTMFDLPRREPETPRYIERIMRSEAAMRGAARLARRLRMSKQTVLFAAAAVVLGQRSGRTNTMIQVLCGNRTDEPLRTHAGNLTVPVPCAFDFTGLSFDQIVLEAVSASMSAQLNCQWDQKAAWVERRAAELAIGRHIDVATYLNILRDDPYAPQDDGVADLRELMTRTVFTPGESRIQIDLKILLMVLDTSVHGAVSLLADTAYTPVHSIDEILRGMERLLVAGASRDIPAGRLSEVTGIRPPDRGPGWVRCRDGHADLAATRDLWRTVVGTSPADLYTEVDRSGGHRMIAYAVAPDRSIMDLHHQLTASLDERTDVRAPDWYVRCADPPHPAPGRASWTVSRVLEEGTGRTSRSPALTPTS
ncbi:hypothetical protein GCM10009677_25560 [Sphaerisporangium rubeum]|uniref:Condensation domain-containing protein n=1 Tax=Sphaerisporangium rubeum TaxID=321317 RepID=A0A7X0IC56_9ACTN|nr:hypothetical protein [Sphaerisporangium rubeum]MBB6471268.1 hypothetical protein [Sphaerisporangium rubeum]